MRRDRPETAAAAMASAVPQEYIDRIERHIHDIQNGKYVTKYAPTMAVEAYQLLSDPRRCWTLKSIAALFGVYDSTLYDWIKENEDLQFAIFSGKTIQENNFGSMLLHGFKYSSGVEFILTNLHNWTIKQKTEHTLDLNAAIAAQENAKKAQGIVWDEQTAQNPMPQLLSESPHENSPVVQQDAEDVSKQDE